MKKIFNDTPTARITGIKRFAIHDGPGIRTTFFLKGCSLKCRWCHNPETISPIPQMACYSHRCANCGHCVQVCPHQAHSVNGTTHLFMHGRCTGCGKCEAVCPEGALKFYGSVISLDDALSTALEDEAFYRESGGGVTLSGGEPLLQSEFLSAFLTALKSRGIHTAVDTCLFVPTAVLEKVLAFTDLFLVDFKHPDSGIHRQLTGQPNEQIRKNLEILSQKHVQIEIRIPIIPGLNDSEKTIRETGEYLSALDIRQVRLLPYHALARSKYAALGMEDTMPDVPPPSCNHLAAVAGILKQCGLNAISSLEGCGM